MLLLVAVTHTVLMGLKSEGKQTHPNHSCLTLSFLEPHFAAEQHVHLRAEMEPSLKGQGIPIPQSSTHLNSSAGSLRKPGLEEQIHSS